MTTFDPVEVRKAVAEFTPRRPQKFQMVEKSLAAVTNARIVPLCFTSRALVTSLHFQDSNKIGGLPSALVGGRCAPAPLAPAHRPQTEASSNQQRVVLQDVKWVAHLPHAGSSPTRKNLPFGFVNCAADDTAPFRSARTLRNRLKKCAISFLLADVHVASCGWLGIHEVHLQASGFGIGIIAVTAGSGIRHRP